MNTPQLQELNSTESFTFCKEVEENKNTISLFEGSDSSLTIVDLRESEELALIRELSSKQDDKPIIAINARSKSQMLDAVVNGASGATSINIMQEEVSLVIQSVIQEYILVDSKREETPHFVILPQKQLIKKVGELQDIIGMELIDLWRAEPFVIETKPDSVLEQLNLSGLNEYFERGENQVPVYAELNNLLQNLSSKGEKERNIGNQQSIVDRWFMERVIAVKSQNKVENQSSREIFTLLEKEMIEKIQTYWRACRLAGTYTLSSWLEILVNRCCEIEFGWEEKHQKAVKDYTNAWVAYSNLTEKVGQQTENERYALNALKLYYQKRIEAEFARFSSLIVNRIIEVIRKEQVKIIEIDTLLYSFRLKLAESLKNKSLEGNSDISQIQLTSRIKNSSRKTVKYWQDRSQELVYATILEESRKLAVMLIVENY